MYLRGTDFKDMKKNAKIIELRRHTNLVKIKINIMTIKTIKH